MNTMSDIAQQNDRELEVRLLPVAKMTMDTQFNCRGWFSPMECTELANDIKLKGLQQPIVVRPLRPETRAEMTHERDLIEKGFEYMVIAGHRRLTAYKINNAEYIPATVKDAYISNFDAKDINAVENLQRKELNLQQEAESIRHYWMASWRREEIASRIGKSPGWVQIRLMLLEMPEEIQTAAGQGYLKQEDIRQLNSIKNPTKRLETAGLIRDKRAKGDKKNIASILIKKTQKVTSKRARKPSELQELIDHLQPVFRECREKNLSIETSKLFTEKGNNLTTRVLAFASGEISNLELHISIRDFAALFGVKYEMPEFDNSL